MNKVILNQIKLKGKLNKPQWSFTDNLGVLHYSAILEIKNPDDNPDYIPVYLTEDLYHKLPKNEAFVEITGIVKGKNIKTKTAVYVLAKELNVLDCEEYFNEIYLTGTISKKTSSDYHQSKAPIKYYLIFDDYNQKHRIPIIFPENKLNFSSGTNLPIIGSLQNKRVLKSFDISSKVTNFSFKINVTTF